MIQYTLNINYILMTENEIKKLIVRMKQIQLFTMECIKFFK